MGKSNRIRAKRANATVSAPRANKKQNKQKGMPGWLMTTIAIVAAVAILLTVAVSLLSANGVQNRLRTSMKSDNFKINTNMMSYYYYTVYQDFQANYESYMSYFSLDTTKSLKKQPFGGDGTKTYYDTYFLGTFEGSWFDYFAKLTKEEVSSMLLYLEEANTRGISLTEEEKNELKASLDSSTSLATLYGYSSVNAYISDIYGKGVSQKDVLKAMEYSALASKMQNTIYDEYVAWLEANPSEIDKKYNENKKDFDLVDFTYYSFRVDYNEIAKKTLGTDKYQDLLKDNKENQDKVLAAYKKAIDEATEKANALIKNEDAESFKKAILEIVVDEAYDNAYETEKADAEKDKLTTDDLKTLRQAMIAEVIANAMADATEDKKEDDKDKKASIVIDNEKKTATAYGKSVPVKFAEALTKIKDTLDSKATSAVSSYVLDKVGYAEEDEFSKWAFADGRKANETKVITEGDGAKEELASTDGYTYVSAYYLRTTARKDTEHTRDVLYALFSKEDDAKKAIEALGKKDKLDATVFEEVVKANNTTGNATIEDCAEGQVGSTEFDKWLFDKDLKIGEYTKTAIKLDSSTWAVVYYSAEGELNWKMTVQNTILSEKQEAQYKEMENQYKSSIVTKDNAIKKIDA